MVHLVSSPLWNEQRPVCHRCAAGPGVNYGGLTCVRWQA